MRTKFAQLGSVDVELVALRVLHRDGVVVKPFGVQDTGELGTETGQAARLRVGAPPARPDRHRAAAADTDIEVQPVLGRFALRYHLEPDPRPPPAGTGDAVRASAQLISGTPRSRRYASQPGAAVPTVGSDSVEQQNRLGQD